MKAIYATFGELFSRIKNDSMERLAAAVTDVFTLQPSVTHRDDAVYRTGVYLPFCAGVFSLVSRQTRTYLAPQRPHSQRAGTPSPVLCSPSMRRSRTLTLCAEQQQHFVSVHSSTEVFSALPLSWWSKGSRRGEYELGMSPTRVDIAEAPLGSAAFPGLVEPNRSTVNSPENDPGEASAESVGGVISAATTTVDPGIAVSAGDFFLLAVVMC